MSIFKKKTVAANLEADSVVDVAAVATEAPEVSIAKTQKQASAKKTTQQYISACKEFEQSRIDQVLKVSKIYKFIAIFCGVLALGSVAALMALTPLKTVEPFLVRIDNNTGATDIVTILKEQKIKTDEALDRYWLTQYIKFREGYNYMTLQATYDATVLLSNDTVNKQFQAIYAGDNAPHKLLRDSGQVVTTIKNISYVGDMAQVRFSKQFVPNDPQVAKKPPVNYIATMAYEYQPQEGMKELDRLNNPMGFKVLSYKVETEY
jgi:type IV secretion system protein VirB8